MPRCTRRRARSAPTRSTTAGRDLSASVGLALERHADAVGVVVLAADLPNVTADDVRELIAHARPLALVAAADGTTNAIAASPPTAFRPSYGPGSAARHGGTPPAPRGHRARRRHARRPRARMPRVTLLAGGVGGARFARGLLACVRPADVTIVGNVGDDLEHWGLSISPDLDTLLYTLTGRIHPEQGWGVAGDTREAMAVVTELGGLDWFILGDRDIGLHLVRSERLRAGEPLSAVTADFARRYGLGARLLPASDDRLRTRIVTPDGELAFQEWLVGRRAADPVRAVRFEGAPGARPAPGRARGDRSSADVIVLAPSNPFVSLDPILAVDGLREAVEARRDRVVAVTPMIGAQAVKGPLGGHARDARPRRLGRRRGAASSLRWRRGFVLDERRPRARAGRARARAERDLRADADARRRELGRGRAGGALAWHERRLASRRCAGSRSSGRATTSPACCSRPLPAAPAACATATSCASPRRPSRRSRAAASQLASRHAVGARAGDRRRRGRSAHDRADPAARARASSAAAARS